MAAGSAAARRGCGGGESSPPRAVGAAGSGLGPVTKRWKAAALRTGACCPPSPVTPDGGRRPPRGRAIFPPVAHKMVPVPERGVTARGEEVSPAVSARTGPAGRRCPPRGRGGTPAPVGALCGLPRSGDAGRGGGIASPATTTGTTPAEGGEARGEAWPGERGRGVRRFELAFSRRGEGGESPLEALWVFFFLPFNLSG